MPPLGPFGFIGGWNTKESSWTLPSNSLTDSQNVNIVHNDLVKRNGSVILNASPLASGAAIHGIFDWRINSGTRYLLVTAGTKIYNSANLSTTFNDITGSATITAGQNNQHTFASLNNIVAICGGATPDTPLQWTGTGNVSALAGSPPVGNIVAVANNFMFISGIAATPSRVYWSNVSDPNTWPAASFIEFRASDGDKVTALLEKDQNIYIFKQQSIGVLFTQSVSVSGTVTLAPLSQLIVGNGCSGRHCVDLLPDGRIVFLGTNNHVYIYDGASVNDVSDPRTGSNIQTVLDSMNISRLPFSVVRVYPTRNQVWISMSSASATTHDTVLVYDYQVNIWVSKFININANILEPVIDTRTTPDHSILMVTGDYAGEVFEQDIGTTDASVSGGTIDGYGTISVLLNPDQKQVFPRSAIIPLESETLGQLTFSYGYNGLTDVSYSTSLTQAQGGADLDSEFTLDVSRLAGSTTLRDQTLLVNAGSVFSIQMQFRNDQASQSFRVHPVYLSEEIMV
jgi:hypothetical protein